jgi:hypothetical protein
MYCSQRQALRRRFFGFASIFPSCVEADEEEVVTTTRLLMMKTQRRQLP